MDLVRVDVVGSAGLDKLRTRTATLGQDAKVGTDLYGRLADAVTRAKGDSPLRLVTVIVPSRGATQQDENMRVTEAVLPGVGVNAVRIMTMHAAKGLQFPMVIVAGMSGGFRTTSDPVVWGNDGTMHLNVCAVLQSVDYTSVSTIEKALTEAERVRLLYVACTRAETLLAVSGYVGAKGSWGKTLAAETAGVPNLVPDLIEPTRVEDLGQSGCRAGTNGRPRRRGWLRSLRCRRRCQRRRLRIRFCPCTRQR